MENNDVIELLKKDKFILYNGIELLEIGEGEATGRMNITENHLNGLGTVQGGAIFTLADYICAAAANSRGKAAVTLDGQMDYIKAVSKGTLYAHATEVFLRRTIASYHVEVRNEEGALIATLQSKVFRKDV
ncbi:MAG: PaaI family thioesterase [Paludibacteraceae bacterium]|nr:PaaI family thioesterase [Paludibacteraceae bacterium]